MQKRPRDDINTQQSFEEEKRVVRRNRENDAQDSTIVDGDIG